MISTNNKRKTFLIVVSLLSTILIGNIYRKTYSDSEYIGLLGRQPVWMFKTTGRILSCLPDKNSGVFVYTTDAVYLVNSVTGELIWKTGLKENTNTYDKYTIQTGIKSIEKVLVVQRGDGSIVSLSTENGQMLWQGISKTGLPVFDMNIDRHFAYVARSSLSLDAYDTSTGEKVWSSDVPDRTSLYVFPETDKVYLGTSYILFVYEAQTGNLLSEHRLDGFLGKMVVDSGSIYASYLNGKYSFTSLDAKTLEYRWVVPQDLLSLSEVNSIVVDDDVVYFSGNKLIALSATDGEILWVSDIKDIFGRAVIHKDFLIIQGKTQIYVLNKVDGNLIGNQKISGFLPLLSWMLYAQANPCASDTTVWLASNSYLYAYDLSR